MRTLLALGVVVTALGVSAAEDKKDPTAGKWVIESVTRDGKAAEALKGAVREHGDGKHTLTPKPNPTAAKKPEPTTGTYAIDATKSPIAIDIKPKGGTYDGKTLLGIVKIDGETLTIAFAEPGKD